MTIATKKISLGLQGGGAYAAFGWGVLDRILEDGRFDIAAISATSGGAINASVLADGYAQGGGREGARQALRRFWQALSGAHMFSPLRRTPVDYLAGAGSMQASPAYHLLQMMSGMLAPQSAPQLPSMGPHPLQALLSSLIDFERVRSCEEIRLFVPATNIRTGKARMFVRDELDARRVAASACLPQVFAAIEVDGEAYWDGSFVGNPALSPLVRGGDGSDILIVQNNPIARSKLPHSVADVSNRATEVAFNISFIREVSAIQHLGAVIDEERGEQVHAADVRLHMITGNGTLSNLDISSKFNVEWPFILQVHEAGREAASRWLDEHAGQVGVRSTLDAQAVYYPERGTVAGAAGT
ncbi:patatin-like phospholipase family protein [Massilia consociata]|uniref:Patatin-like phospholipase family protein n=1 Tax=Massilia consociata TaxID=760117 RepID=A0ABV6FCZ7_9BURK